MADDFDYADTDLLAFIDETGHPSMSDPGHPVFGVGGCAVPYGAYWTRLHIPWLSLRSLYFPELAGPMHASGALPTAAQSDAIGRFFLQTPIIRVAALATLESGVLPGDDAFESCSTLLLSFLHQVAVRNNCERIVLTFESAGKSDELANRLLQMPTRFAASSVGHLPIRVMCARKEERVPGLEIADFIMHAAGGQIRRTEVEPRNTRKDFSAVFSGVPDEWVYFGVKAKAGGEPPPPAFPVR